MPHTEGKRYAVVSCHVERPLDDDCWRLFRDLQERRPGGFAVAPLLRPPDAEAGEDEAEWVGRARLAGARGPLGHHTHFVSATHARPSEPGGDHAGRVRREAGWMREQGLEPRFFCGGGWYMDASVAAAVADLGYADCTATGFRPAYLDDAAPRLSAATPVWLELEGGRRLVELPTTHSLGMTTRALASRGLPSYVHVYFHDTDLLSHGRRLALYAALTALGRRCEACDLDALRELSAALPGMPFGAAARGARASPA